MKRREFGQKLATAAIGASVASRRGGFSAGIAYSEEEHADARWRRLPQRGGPGHHVESRIWNTTCAMESNTSPCKRRIVRKAAAGIWMH